jgi:transcriptional regulator with XRE-family HTH domain
VSSTELTKSPENVIGDPSDPPSVDATRDSQTTAPTRSQRGAAIRAAYRGKFTQVQLAAALGVAQNTISRWSTGDVEPSLDDLVRLEDVCDLTRGHILRAAGYVDDLGSAEDFIASDHRLDPVRRELLLTAYMAALHQSQHSHSGA